MNNLFSLRQSLKTGLLMGVLLILAMAFIAINDIVTSLFPGWSLFSFPWIPRDVLRTFSLVASSVLLLFIGTLAAMRARPIRFKDGFKTGAFSGLIAGVVIYLCLIAPLVVVWGGADLYHEYFHSALETQPEVLQEYLLRAIERTWRVSLSTAVAVPMACLLLGGLEGLVYTFLRRASGAAREEQRPPALLDLAGQQKPFRLSDPEEHALKAGLLGGAIVGGTFSLALLLGFTQIFIRELPGEIGRFMESPSQMPPETVHWLEGLTIVLLFLVPFALCLWGGLGILLLKHPRTRFGSRLRTSAVSGSVGGSIVALIVGLPMINMVMAAAPVLVAQDENVSLTTDQLFRGIRLLILYPAIPLVLILLWALLGLLTGLPFVYVLPFIWPRRPVDRAASLTGQIRRQPGTLLPQIYALFQRERQAVEVLKHTSQQLHRRGMRPEALVAAAYHTIYEYPERSPEAIRTLADTITQYPDWRWHTEIGELYRFLGEGLRVRNIHHLAAIRPLPEEQTSSLPPTLAQMGEKLSRAVSELKKVQRLDDPNSRSIYLNRVLEQLTAAEQFLDGRASAPKGAHCPYEGGCATPYPEHEVLAVLLPQWRSVVYDTLRDLRGRALLKIELQNRRASYIPDLPLRLQVTNEGMNVAEQVRISLQPSADYSLSAASEGRIEMLPPGEEQVVQLHIQPRNPRHIRVLMHIYYNDAVEENREITLADEITFVEEGRPFQRIFPIPYVTGTPLKTGEMFFGRQDVFEYVREHLLGTYQNNIIVLHGQRRTGKTSVLYRLQQVMHDTHYAVLLDMQGMAARSEPEFFYALSDEIAYALEKDGLEVEIPEMEEYESQPEFTFRSRFLRGLYPALGEKHLLLMFDEFEELQHHVEAGHIGAGLFPFLRNLMQHEEPLDFVFSGTHKLEELAAEYWSILFNIATYKKISFLEHKDAERLIVEPVAPYGMEYDPLSIEHIYQVTAGQPFLSQLVCHEMVAYHNETERNYITVADVDAVLERIAERGEAHFKYIWDGSDAAARAVLLALAELLGHAPAATLQEVLELSERRGRSLSKERALGALVRLESRDIVSRTALGSDRFRFRVDLVRRWIARNPQLADTVELGEPGEEK